MTASGHLLRIAWAAHPGAAPDTTDRASDFLRGLMPHGGWVMTEEQPDVILFMSGGSERMAIELAEAYYPVLLLSIEGNNAYAAATEVMAWMVNHNRPAVLSDAEEAMKTGLIERWRTVAGALRTLRGKRAGLVGSVSEWLVASDVPADRLNDLFGITLQRLPWDTLPDFGSLEPDASLLMRSDPARPKGIDDAARILSLIRQVISSNNLDAVAVECFSLVQQRRVTACLALAQLNAEGTVAACEGDLASMTGMMFARSLTGTVPWMANTTRLTGSGVILSHCTIAFNMVGEVKYPTHFETDRSLAVEGTVTATDVTLFRFSADLDRAFISEGRVTGIPHMRNACRTQVEINLPPAAVDTLRNKPLGNHLLMMPGKYSGLLRLACMTKNIAVTPM